MESEIFAIDSELMVRLNSFNIFSCIFHFMVSFNSLNISSNNIGNIYIFGCTFLMVGFFSMTISSIGGSWPPPLRLHRRLPGKLHGEERSRGDNLASRLHLLLSSDPGCLGTHLQSCQTKLSPHINIHNLCWRSFPELIMIVAFSYRTAWLVASLLTGPKGSSARVLRLVFF